jgi:SAM-dependent methyltransferase
MANIKQKILSFFKPALEFLSEIECLLSKTWAASAHKRLLSVQWGLMPQPENFDHHIDLYYQWQLTRNPLWLERGVFSNLSLKGGNVLELACGDGFNARNFYSIRSKSVIACDFDPSVIKTAIKKNSAPNISFVLADIRNHMPDGKFENVVWDAAIEHFNQEEIRAILESIKIRLTSDGLLSGYTIVERSDGTKSLHHHEYEFKSKEDLLDVLKPYFKNVTIFETIYPERHNLYFWASDTVLPFSPEWARSINS